jgi:hypothetical protein
MGSVLPTFRRISIAVMLAGEAIGCGSPTQPGSNGQVQVAGTVRDFQTNAAVGGARVTFDNVTAMTDANGVYSLTVQAGQYTISIDGERIAVVNLKDRTYRGDVYVHLTGCIARYGTVVDSWTRRPVPSATVSVGGMSVVTDRAGWFRLSLGCPGVPCIGFNTTFLTITHPDYRSGSFIAGRGVCFVERVDYELEPR